MSNTGQMQLGRARLAMTLPRPRTQLRVTRDERLFNIFEAYARASSILENLLREVPRREEQISESRQICLHLQAEINARLTVTDDRAFP